jgi:ABC-type polysaccharide/polyol phosphate export permease
MRMIRRSAPPGCSGAVALTIDGLDDSLPPAPSMSEHLSEAAHDFERAFIDWRMWLLLGTNDIKQRYQRSRVGQFWITLSMMVMTGSLGFVYSYLFRTPIKTYLPFLATGIIAWTLLSSLVIEACGAFTTAETYLRQVPISKSIFVNRVLVRNLVIFAHNLLIAPVLYITLGGWPGWPVLLVPLGLLVIAANGFWIGLLLGTLCARFRDLPQLVASAVQIAFFITPVMWSPDQLPSRVGWLTTANPMASLLALLRDPLLGDVPKAHDYVFGISLALAGLAVAVPFFARFRARIVYWL